MGAPSLPGRVGPFRIARRLGAGGMGVVYLGYDGAGNAVAVKLIRSEYAAEPVFRARLRRELTAARRVPRFCTAPVLAADLDVDPPWVATEFIDGPTLDVMLLEQGRLVGAELEALAVGVAGALRAIHGQGVIHRDLKPSNILLSQVGPRVIDFGIARMDDGAEVTQLTAPGAAVGTPAYMAPEQLRSGHLTAAVDVFAWASVVTQAGTGRLPFGSGSAHHVAGAIVHSSPDLGDLAEPLRSLVTAAFNKDPGRRPTAADLVDQLSQDAAATTAHVVATATKEAPRLPAQPRSRTVPDQRYYQTTALEQKVRARPLPSPGAARPTAVRVAGAALSIAGLGLLGSSAASLSVMDVIVQVTEQRDAPWGGAVAGLAFLNVICLASLGVRMLVSAWYAHRGMSGTRQTASWSISLTLFLCLPVSVPLLNYGAMADPSGTGYPSMVMTSVPAWYAPVTTASAVTTVAAILVAVPALAWAPAGWFSRRR